MGRVASAMANRLAFVAVGLMAQLAAVSGMAPSSSNAATFLQNRVNLPTNMRGKGYFVTGSFSGKQTFGVRTKCDRTGEFCRTVGSMTLKARGASDAYLAHYDERNQPVWAIKMGSDGEDKGRAIAVDPADGNVVAFGYFSGVGRFGHLNLKSTRPRLDCAHGCAGFVAKFLKDGRALWVRELGQPVHKGPQDAQTTASVDYWDQRAVEFMLSNPEPVFNLDYWSDSRKETTIMRNVEDLEKYV